MLQLDAVRMLRRAEARSPVMVVKDLRRIANYMRQQNAMYELAIEIRREIRNGADDDSVGRAAQSEPE